MVLREVVGSRLTGKRWTKGKSTIFGRTLYERYVELRASSTGRRWDAHLIVEYVGKRGIAWIWNVHVKEVAWIASVHASGYAKSAEAAKRGAVAGLNELKRSRRF